MSGPSNIEFSDFRGVAAEGGRIGIVTCLECGTTIALDPSDERDVMALHRRWHEVLDDTRNPPKSPR